MTRGSPFCRSRKSGLTAGGASKRKGPLVKEYETITLELSEDIATLSLNRVDKMNALDTQMRAEITDAAGYAGRNARVLVLTGKGRAFCSGQDLSDSGNAASIDLERCSRTNMCRCCARSAIARSRRSAP